MDDGFLSEKKWSEQIKKKIDFPQNGASEEVFFQRKKRNTDVILMLRGKLVSTNKNGAAK